MTQSQPLYEAHEWLFREKKRSIYIYEEERKMAASFQSLSSNNQLLLSEGQGWLEC